MVINREGRRGQLRTEMTHGPQCERRLPVHPRAEEYRYVALSCTGAPVTIAPCRLVALRPLTACRR